MQAKTAMSEMDLPDVFDCKIAALFLKVHRNTVYDLANKGCIPCCRVGREYRFHKTAIIQWLRGEKNGMGTGTKR